MLLHTNKFEFTALGLDFPNATIATNMIGRFSSNILKIAKIPTALTTLNKDTKIHLHFFSGLFGQGNTTRGPFCKDILKPDLEMEIDKNDYKISLHSLAGHKDIRNQEALMRVRYNHWVAQFISLAREDIHNNRIPLFIGCSTSCLAATIAATRKEDFFGGMIFTGSPFINSEKSNRFLEIALPHLFRFRKIDRAIRRRTDNMIVNRGERSEAEKDLYADGGERKAFREYSQSAIWTFGMCRWESVEKAKKLSTPVLYVHGSKDSVSQYASVMKIASMNQGTALTINLHNVPHIIPRSKDGAKPLAEIIREICTHLIHKRDLNIR